jgi:predicted phosphate transport protein (TIGR00153 family)
MARMKFFPFGRTKEIEEQINEFLDKLSEASLVFEMGVQSYLSGHDEGSEEKLEQVGTLERRGDELRRQIETALYAELLIPDFRGDVLSLLEDLDVLLDLLKWTLRSIVIERHEIPDDCCGDLTDLVSVSVKSIECTVSATRSFFIDFTNVRDHIHKIGFYEREADKIAIRLKKNIFTSQLPLDRKLHIRDLVEMIERLADEAENVGDRLSIYTIKRTF